MWNKILLNLSVSGQITVILSAFLSIFAPVTTLAIVVFLFILVDFIFGVIVSYKVKKQGINSKKVYRTIWKLVGAEVCIILAYVLDTHVLSFTPRLHLPNIFTGIICGAEFWSILTNLAILSDHPIFRVIKKYAKTEIESKIGKGLIEELEKEQNKTTDNE